MTSLKLTKSDVVVLKAKEVEGVFKDFVKNWNKSNYETAIDKYGLHINSPNSCFFDMNIEQIDQSIVDEF